MSKMPALSRSFHSVSLNVFRRFALFGSCVLGLKSEAARRTFSTPRPVPVRIQSCAEQGSANKMARKNNGARKRPLRPLGSSVVLGALTPWMLSGHLMELEDLTRIQLPHLIYDSLHVSPRSASALSFISVVIEPEFDGNLAAGIVGW